MAGKNKKTKTDMYYDWMKKNRSDSILAQEHRERFMEDLKELSSL